ncbi:hypothetical protein M3181_17225 [Mesobacillus maritimus]|uniref:carbamoyltransferase N-terminal domain-containing protein n=1 Tax=Mesobacillus maritimus TaxID=1643336 RepID=UPI00203D01B8|nr:carbamoyltransferase N-terminal domain-containing protein [Mesobacillus maritimus]MCM3670702.1 hypothetical protein [Mesobacillus maritimus]
MIICGLKLTHDGAVALIEDGKLVFSIEMEKLNNHPRYKDIEDTKDVLDILTDYGIDPSTIDYFAIDGWGGDDEEALAVQPRLKVMKDFNTLSISNHGERFELKIGQYEENSKTDNLLKEWSFDGLKIADQEFSYTSYLHAAGHVVSAYCTSEFAKKGESSYVLVWDGGMYPRLYYFDMVEKKFENLGPIFLLIGNIYTIFSQHFGPFKVNGNFAKDNLSIAGKVMAYIALGEVKRELFTYFDEIYNNDYTHPMGFGNVFANKFKERIQGMGYSDEDILCTFHAFLEEMLINKLQKKIQRHKGKSRNLCIAGGCALNIKWNSAIRNTDLFDTVYVPPFPNDSGSAIGAACCAMIQKTGQSYLDWSVYSGPDVIQNEPAEGWVHRDCSVKELSRLLFESNEPIVLLNGKAELGPRALGNRSIIASPISEKMKNILNDIKNREDYRPVSPICLEEKAKDVFKPGISDPFMLFDHEVRDEWKEKIPAVIHLDGTARLQTVHDGNRILRELLEEFEGVSEIPVLCNTSANFKGTGFFPDVFSASKWDKVNYIWCNHTLYEKQNKQIFS